MSDQKFIYLISVADGENEDGDPIDAGYFSTHELAEAEMMKYPDQPWVEILTIPLDWCSLSGTPQPVEPIADDTPSKTIYEAVLKIIWDESGPRCRTFDCRAGKIRPGGFLITEADKNGGHYDRVTVESEISMEHAVEVVYQARQKFIADRTGKLSYDPDWHLKDRFSEGVA